MLIVAGIFGLCVLVFIGAMLIGYDVVKEAKPVRDYSTPKSNRLIIGWIILLLTFLAFSLFIGGTAQHGYVKEGKYFVSSRGEATQVGWAVWYISLTSTYVLIFGFVCVFAVRFYEWRFHSRDNAD